jgi:hypothetical protein
MAAADELSAPSTFNDGMSDDRANDGHDDADDDL